MPLTNLEKVQYYFKDYESPTHFITWAALFAIGACLGRKVFWQKGEPLFPNEQMIFVAPPGVGKSLPLRKLMGMVESLTKFNPLTKMPDPLVNIAPTCTTLEELYNILERCGTAIPKEITGDKVYFHSSLAFMITGEMGTLFKPGPSASNLTLFLNDGYDCAPRFDYSTKRSGKNHLKNLCVNFLGCCTPDWVARNLDSQVIGNGWSSRVLWIYGEDTRQLTTKLTFTEEQDKILDGFKEHLKYIAELYGEVTMTPECYEMYDKWYQSNPRKNGRINMDSNLDDYYSRVRTHTLKIAMLHHFLEKKNMVLDCDDFEFALQARAEIEPNMHRALASMTTNPYALLAREMLRAIQAGEQKGGMSSSELMMALYEKSPRGAETIEEVKAYLNISKQIKQIDGRWVTNKVVIDVTEDQFRRGVKPLTEQEIKDAAYGK